MTLHRRPTPGGDSAVAALKAVLMAAACTFTLTASECVTVNPQTLLDGSHHSDDRDSPLVDIDHLDAPRVVVVDEVGQTFRIEVSAEDADGNPLPDTEARINADYDPEMIELLYACGGEDEDVPECAGLTPAYHLYENDGVMWMTFRALQSGETDITFLYPGATTLAFESGHRDPDQPFPAEPVPHSDVGEFTDQATTHVVIGGAASDQDGDGVPDFEDECPDSPPDASVDEDGCPLSDPPADSDGDGVADEDDDCPGTPEGVEVDENGCPVPDDEEPPTLGQIAPGSYVFRGEETSNQCGFTNVSDEAPAETSNEGGIMPLKITTFFPATGPAPAPTTTVHGPYDPSTGEYLANGTSAVGAEHDLEGFWTMDPDGDPRFDGVLTERFLSPTCENTFDVSYSID